MSYRRSKWNGERKRMCEAIENYAKSYAEKYAEQKAENTRINICWI